MTLSWFLASLLSIASAAPLSADQAVVAALSRSPELAEAEAAVARAEGTRRAECGLRHDPTLSASVALVGEAWSASLSQPLSLTGEGLAACASARHAQDAAAARHQRAELEVAAATRRAWITAVVASAEQDLAAQALDVARGILVAARQRQAVGEVSQLDLRLARLQVEQARTAWLSATVDQGRSVTELASRTGLGVDDLDLPGDPLAAAALLGAGQGSVLRSDVVAAGAAVDAATAALTRERSATLGPVELGLFVEEEGPELRAGPSLALTLPLWRGNVDGRAEARADLASAEASHAATERRAAAERSTTRRSSAALDAALADQDVDIPAEARAALDSVALGYDRGELDLLSTALLQAEILDGHGAWLEGRRVVAEARLERLLAEEDRRLLGEDRP